MKTVRFRNKVNTRESTYDSLIVHENITDLTPTELKEMILPKSGCPVVDMILGVAESLKAVIQECNSGYETNYKASFYYYLEDGSFVLSAKAGIETGDNFYDEPSGMRIINRLTFDEFFKRKYPQSEHCARYAAKGLFWIKEAESSARRQNFKNALFQFGHATHQLKLAVISKLEVAHHVRNKAEGGFHEKLYQAQIKKDVLDFVFKKMAEGKSQNHAIELAIKSFGNDAPKRTSIGNWVRERKK